MASSTAIRTDAKRLAIRWRVDVKHALYRETGDWYHQLERFPGALFDSEGYIVFETRESYRSCPFLRIKQDVNVPSGIRRIPGYVHVVVDGVQQPLTTLLRGSYETANRRKEGAAFEVTSTRYERDPAARSACIEYHGLACAVCGMTFASRYGTAGEGYIHVHHLEQLAIAGEREVDPIRDLRPVCANCHAMLHQHTPPFSIATLKKMLR